MGNRTGNEWIGESRPLSQYDMIETRTVRNGYRSQPRAISAHNSTNFTEKRPRSTTKNS